MSYSTATGIIKIPVLFDMSGDAVVFGEEATGDFVTSHLDFLLDMTTEANDISLNAADISSAILIGDQETGDNIFYSGGSSGNVAVDNLCNRIAKAITRGKLVHIPKSGDHSNSGIPMGGRAELVDSTGTHTTHNIQNAYTSKYTTSIAPIGDEQMLGQAMARVASIHLVGSPLAAGIFEDKNQIQTDLETASTQTFNDGNTAFYNALAVQLSKVLGGSKSSAPMNNGNGSGSSGGGGTPTPYDIASSNSTLSGQAYTASSKYNNASRYFAHDAFDGVITGVIDSWVSADNTYSNGSHNNTNANTTTDGYAGEWVQVDIGQDIVLKSFQIYPRQASGELNMTPKNMRLFSSTDGTNWTQVKDWTGLTTNDWYPSSTWSSVGPYTTNTTGRYFRLVINENIGNSTYTQIGEIELKGLLPSEDSSGSSGGYPLDASGVAVPALKSIYEQLMNVPGRSQIMQTRDISGTVDNSNVTLTGGFPFISGDKLIVYLRPKIHFAAQTQPEQHSTLVGFPEEFGFTVPVYDIGRKNSDGGALTGQTYTQSSMFNQNTDVGFNKCFEGSLPDTSSYWLTAGTGGANPSTDHRYATNGGDYIGEAVTRSVGEEKNITVTSAQLKNNNQIVDATDPFIKTGGFVFFLDIQVGDTVTYEHPTLGSQTTTVSGVTLSSGKPYLIELTDNHDVASATTIASCTFHNKRDYLMGEWGEVDIGQNTAVKQIDLWPYPPDQETDIPKDFHLLGSADGTSWDILKKVDNEDWGLANSGGIKEYTITPSGPYRYYRISVQRLVNNTSNNNFSLAQMVIWGALHPSEFYKTILPVDISGLVTNFTATAENIVDAFPGKTTGGPNSEELKWGWMGSSHNNVLTQDTTDITELNTIDLHIWKITITL